MSNRKYASVLKSWKKKRRIEKLIKSQQGALHKFVTIHKKDDTTSSTDTIMEENPPLEILNNINTVEQNIDNENIQEVENLNNINSPNPSQEQWDNKILREDNLETNKELNSTSNEVSKNIYDPGQWENIDENFRELIVGNGPIRYNYI